MRPADLALVVVLAAVVCAAGGACAALVRERRRRIAADTEREQASAQGSRLLAAQHQFLQDASHQLRTPITIGLGHAELLQRMLAGQPAVGYLQVVVDELYRLRRLAERLLVIAASEDPAFLNREPVALREFIAETIGQWRPTAPRSWEAGRADDVTVLADRERLRQAVDSLLENAVRHTAEHDVIRISVIRSAHSARILVADTGSGITPYDLPRIFDRFRTGAGSAASGGTGLGLTLVRAIASAHGGEVDATSVPGAGSEFTLVLPAEPGGAAAGPAGPAEPGYRATTQAVGERGRGR